MERAHGSRNVCFVDCKSHNTHAFQRKRLRGSGLVHFITHLFRQNTLGNVVANLGSLRSKSVLSGSSEQKQKLFRGYGRR